MKLPQISAEGWRRFHGIATLVWAALITPTVILWHSSILWVALMSVWANMATHFGAYQASRAEVKADEINAGTVNADNVNEY